ncbi:MULTISPECIES: TniB family NTP-binding protein [Rhizobium]|uniref:TniB family NTP-binding protein n=1 Tax=Rhizobium TaxID=379 RepID=UPI0007EA4607|nr:MULTISPECIES: AAA family ATPase [Rhizobium]ANK92761.1 AAA ATPase domain-containing protein [Rhizobium sp. N6212]ANK98806.1 AAA ATPase domain-containing protein [Rhizobium sp. N621]ANL04934.1 AAA ATPase domain-containing protein [Rhizobium esperanzae]ANL10993.1 AAA ATPase domain-containing protein [Rhizobium sp. N1341]ANL23045.1 AAA ATPase domain-containing protein [Rhizobium sp. N113]
MKFEIPQFHTTAFDTKEARRKVSLLPDPDREDMVRDLLVPFAPYEEAVAFIKRRHRPNPKGNHSRGRVIGLLGEIRAGKSYACQSYASFYPMEIAETGSKRFRVVYVPVSPKPTIRSVTNLLQRGAGAHSVSYNNMDDAKDASVSRLLRAETELVIFDDAQFMLFNRAAGDFFDLVKCITDTGRMNVLLSGERSIEEYMKQNGHLLRRGAFPKHIVKPIQSNGKAFWNMMNSVDKRLPFKSASVLTNRCVVEDFWRISNGIIGLVMNIVVDAAIMAIADGSDSIELKHLKAEADDRFQDDTYKYFTRLSSEDEEASLCETA